MVKLINKQHTSIAVLGAGAWGTALAVLLARNGCSVRLWDHDSDHVDRLIEARCNSRHLPGVDFPKNLTVLSDIPSVLSDISEVWLVVPSHGFRAVLEKIKPYLTKNTRLAWGTKGFSASGRLLDEVAREIVGDLPMAVISGPTFAREVASGSPAAVMVGSRDEAYAQTIADWLHNDTFRVYIGSDVVGIEICGAVKNVLAIAVGIADGMGFGSNTRCALIARGLAELMRLGTALGGQKKTFMGLAGLGDLVLTCTDDQSRNRRFGLLLGQGMSPDKAEQQIDQVVEGARVAKEVHYVAKKHHIDMPICEQVYRIIRSEATPRDVVNALLARPPGVE